MTDNNFVADPKGPSEYFLRPGQSITITSASEYDEAYLATIRGLEKQVESQTALLNNKQKNIESYVKMVKELNEKNNQQAKYLMEYEAVHASQVNRIRALQHNLNNWANGFKD